jgi:Flp pilus assembly protein CpaB
VTLSVSLEESELLAFASTQAALSLVLRGEGDLEIVRDVPEKSIEDVWNVEKRNALQFQKNAHRGAIERLRAR